MTAKRIRLLLVGDAIATTGFATVLHNIIGRVKGKYEVHHLGINYHGDPHDVGWKIYPASMHGDVYGVNRLEELILKVRPSLVFLLYDIWVLTRYAAILRKYRKELVTIMYFPVDGSPVEPTVVHDLRDVDYLVAYTEFGRQVMLDAVTVAQKENCDLADREILVIPHGVDSDTFFPLLPGSGSGISGRQVARERLFPNKPDILDSFIVLNANRNQPRKRIDITMKGFAVFSQGKPPNVKLYLHMGVEDRGWNLFAMAKRLGIDDRLIVTSAASKMPAISREQLNLIYNTCDVGINTSTGEGWGLVSFEHAATGAAQIVPRHTACAELWDGAAELVEPAFSLTVEKVLSDAHFVTPESIAAALDRLYADPHYMRKMSEAAYRNALQRRYAWNNVALQWDELFQTALAGREASPCDRSRPGG